MPASLSPATLKKLLDQRAKAGRGARPGFEVDEWLMCSRARGATGFIRFCEKWVRIIDRETERQIPFVLFPGQRRIVADMVAGRWLLVLKGRQVGFTWLFAAYVLWNLTFRTVFSAGIVNQERDYAEDFLARIKWMHGQLPPWMRVTFTKDNTERIECKSDGHLTECRVYVSSPKAARSVTGDLIIWDEADYHDYLRESLQAGIPSIEVAKGQAIINSTAAGPGGEFHRQWELTCGVAGADLDAAGVGPTGFKPFFIHWSERPGRDAAWYEREKERLTRIGGPIAVKREYPDNPEEAFEHAAGRVYPYFTTKPGGHVGDVEIPHKTDRYRAIDWGESESAYVCLWAAHFGGKAGLLVSPRCPNVIREMVNYRRDEESGEPLKLDDHCPDALRYLVTTCRLTGLVYIYREIYRTHSLEKGWTPMDEIKEIHEASGWRPARPESRRLWVPTMDGEEFVTTVADSAGSYAIRLFNQNDIPTIPSKKFGLVQHNKKVATDKPLSDKEEGIKWVSMLIQGTHTMRKYVVVTEEERLVSMFQQMTADRSGATTTIPDRIIAHKAREILAARDAKSRSSARARRPHEPPLPDER